MKNQCNYLKSLNLLKCQRKKVHNSYNTLKILMFYNVSSIIDRNTYILNRMMTKELNLLRKWINNFLISKI
jgi:hypothetical protein